MAQTTLSTDELILLSVEDNAEGRPWMVMADRQFSAASDLAQIPLAYGKP
jgi:hypothetical protein